MYEKGSLRPVWRRLLTCVVFSTIAITTAAGLFGTMTVPVVAAQDNKPIWRRNLHCDSNHQAYRGLEYCTSRNGPMHVLVADLYDQYGLGFEYVIAEGANRHGVYGECRDVNLPAWSSGPGCYHTSTGTYPIMSLEDATKRVPNTVAVIDTDYGAKSNGDRGHGPEGLTIVRGERLDGPNLADKDNNAVRRPWLALSQAGPFQVELGQLVNDSGAKPYDWIYTGVGGAPWLVRNGVKDEVQIDNCTNATSHSCTSDVAQTAVGLSQSRRWLYFVAAEGMDANAITDFMLQELEVWNAIKLDGGGSTQLWYRGVKSEEDPFVLRGDGRLLSQYLSITASSGSGISLTTPLLDAVPTDSTSYIILSEGESRTFSLTYRNEGQIAWHLLEGITLVEQPPETRELVSRAFNPQDGLVYYLPRIALPGQTVSWSFPAESNSGIHIHRYQMAQEGLGFGTQARYVVVVIPEALQDQREELEQIIADLQVQGEQEIEAIVQAIQDWAADQGRNFLERLFESAANLIQELIYQLIEAIVQAAESACSGIALIPAVSAGVLILARRRES